MKRSQSDRKADWPPAAMRPSGRVSEDTARRRARANQDAIFHTCVWQNGPMQPFTSSVPAPLRRMIER